MAMLNADAKTGMWGGIMSRLYGLVAVSTQHTVAAHTVSSIDTSTLTLIVLPPFL